MEHNFVKVKFRIDSPVSGELIEDNIVGKPITIDDNAVGYIHSANTHGTYCDCEGIIWDRCLGTEYLRHMENNSVEIISVELGGGK